MVDSSIILAFSAGLISFFSPCIFPLFPIYLSTLKNEANDSSLMLILNTLIFTLSFSIIFLLLALTTTSIGLFLNLNKILLIKFSGILIMFFGLVNLNLVRLHFLDKNYNFSFFDRLKLFKPIVLGLSFGFAWTPCIGPILASILSYSAAGKNYTSSLIMLGFYSIGLGIPFLLGSLGYKNVLSKFNKNIKIYKLFNILMGILLLIFGFLVYNNKIYILNIYSQKFFDYFN
ncbi:MAG: cytochrome c biogenesis CcdA family protein [bacterium]